MENCIKMKCEFYTLKEEEIGPGELEILGYCSLHEMQLGWGAKCPER